METVSYGDFSKLDLRVGRIVSAEKVAGADKLLKLTVKIGEEQRTIAAGIAKFYTPEEVVNKAIIVVANLEPRKLRGIESQGMLLAAVEEGNTNIVVLTTDREVQDGCKVS